jgi:hypothetical protein
MSPQVLAGVFTSEQQRRLGRVEAIPRTVAGYWNGVMVRYTSPMPLAG